jgi:hypothetical protein
MDVIMVREHDDARTRWGVCECEMIEKASQWDNNDDSLLKRKLATDDARKIRFSRRITCPFDIF